MRAFSRAFYSELASGVPVHYTALSAPAAGLPFSPGRSTIEEHQLHIEVSALPRAEGAFQRRYNELKQLGSWLTGDARKRIVSIHRGGGQGKTALAGEAIERLAYAYPGSVWATVLEHLPSRADFITDLARFLSIPIQAILEVSASTRRSRQLTHSERSGEHWHRGSHRFKAASSSVGR